MFTNNKYTITYYNIINRAKSRTLEGYIEKHHIIPKSLGGDNSKDNLVRLTAREHYICHLLLTKMTSGDARRKMAYAIHRLTNTRNSKVKSSKIYEMIKILRSNAISEDQKGVTIMERCGKPYPHEISDFQKDQIRKSNSMRVWTEESKQRLSASQKARYIENPDAFKRPDGFTDAHRRKIGDARRKNSKKYLFAHPVHGIFEGSTGDLARAYTILPSEVYLLAVGRYKTYKKWRCVSDIVRDSDRNITS